MKNIVAFLLVLLASIALVFAQPSDEQIKKDISNAGTKKITFTKSTGTRQWNKDIGNWEYVRGVKILRASQFAGIDVEVEGDAVYQFTGTNKYQYWKFRTISNNYIGLPNPKESEIIALLSTNWAKFFGYNYNNITAIHEQPALAPMPDWIWDSPTKVNVKMRVVYDMISSTTHVAKAEHIREVRLFRNDTQSPWREFLIYSESDPTILETREVGESAVKQLRKKTLAFTEKETMAQQQVQSLPKVVLPEIRNAMDATNAMHNLLRNGTAEEFKAAALQLLAPSFFVQNSTTQLTPYGEQTLNDIIKRAYNGTLTYKQLYCQKLQPTSLTSGNSVYFSSCIKNLVSEIAVAEFALGYKEGIPQKAWRIIRMEIRTRDDDDAVNFINSFSDPRKLCPND